jgi:hypothetical protein
MSAPRPGSTFPKIARRVLCAVFVSMASVVRLGVAHAEVPLFDLGQGATEDAYADGDLDAEDLLSAKKVRQVRVRPPNVWFAVSGWVEQRENATTGASGRTDVGVYALLGFALDRVAMRIAGGPPSAPHEASLHWAEPPGEGASDGVDDHGPDAARSRESSEGRTASEPDDPNAEAPGGGAERASAAMFIERSPPRIVIADVPITPAAVRAIVRAALRAAGLGTEDARLASLIARARASALLPETRLRAMRTEDAQARFDASIDNQRFTGTNGANVWLEGRLTWRLDRLLFADEEISIERIRLDRHDARMRLVGKVLDATFKWQRARLELATQPEGSRAAFQAAARIFEAEALLDVMTGGYFSRCAGAAGPTSAAPP